MEDELFTMMLVLAFAAVMILAGRVFIDQRKGTEAAMFSYSALLQIEWVIFSVFCRSVHGVERLSGGASIITARWRSQPMAS
jgi:hypothetical protein